MTKIFHDEDRDVCACEAAAAINAVLDRRCPEVKMAFWRAVEKHYRRSTEPEEQPSAAPGVDPDDQGSISLSGSGWVSAGPLRIGLTTKQTSPSPHSLDPTMAFAAELTDNLEVSRSFHTT